MMLRFIAFENLINFKERQYLEFEDGVNFLVGANSTGKSSILELIRRCHSVHLSSSVTNLLDDNKVGYIISRYDTSKQDDFEKNAAFKTDTALLCSFQERKKESIFIYKCICFESENKGELYIAASQYNTHKLEDKPKIVKKIPLQKVKVTWTEDFIRKYFPKRNEVDDEEMGKHIGNGVHEEQTDAESNSIKHDSHDKVSQQNSHQDEGDDEIGSIFDEEQNGVESLSKEHDLPENFTQSDAPRKDTEEPGKPIEFLLFEKIQKILEQAEPGNENSKYTSECFMRKLQSSFACVFPVRSIGPLQWINGNSITDEELNDSKNDENVCVRANILSELLPPEEEQDKQTPDQSVNKSAEYENITHGKEKDLFEKVTSPLVYQFKKDKGNKIIVIHKNDPGSRERQFELIKAPEGIIEAKQATLIFSHKKFRTICYEDMDKGMHNQMIENMNFVLKDIKRKTVIIVTHNPSFINGWTLRRTHVCSRRAEESGKFVNIVKKVPKEKAEQYGVHHEFKKILFSASVLLVEGPSELNVLRALFDYILLSKPKELYPLRRHFDKKHKSKKEFTDNFLRSLCSLQVISVNGKENFPEAEKFCKAVNIPVKALKDDDDICTERKNGNDLELYKKMREPCRKPNELYWDNGTLEDALRADCPSKISAILKYKSCTEIEWENTYKKKLKNKLNKGFRNENYDYDELFKELFEKIRNEESSEFLTFFKFIIDQR